MSEDFKPSCVPVELAHTDDNASDKRRWIITDTDDNASDK